MSEPLTDAERRPVDPAPIPQEQPADSPGKDENGDGLPGGQTTADNHGDILGI
jgi:hypothetical protein